MKTFSTILISLLICNCGGGSSTPRLSEETDAGPQINCGPNTTLIDNVCWSKDEACDGQDDDGDGETDEGCPDPQNNVICGEGTTLQNGECVPLSEEDYDKDNDGYSPFDGDCDDSDPNVNPGAIDWCDQLNNDCDDLMNEDDPNLGRPCIADLYDPATDIHYIVQGNYVCGEGGLVCAPPTLEDCQMSDEICNDIFDDNCDGQVDEGCDPFTCENDDDCVSSGSCNCELSGNFVCTGQSGLCVDGVCETSQNVMECELGCNQFGCLSECAETPTGSAEPGDVVKGTFNALYFISQENFRYVVPNETMYFSWHYDNSCVKTITDQELADMPLAANVCMRYGTHLVKIQSIPHVYAVSTNCDIYKIADQQSAQKLFGANWQDRVYDVTDAFWPNYTVTEVDLFGGWYPDGFVLQIAGSDDVYLIWDGQKRLFASDQAFIDNRFQERFITFTTQETLDFYPDGSDITGCEPDLVDDSQQGGGVCL